MPRIAGSEIPPRRGELGPEQEFSGAILDGAHGFGSIQNEVHHDLLELDPVCTKEFCRAGCIAPSTCKTIELGADSHKVVNATICAGDSRSS